MKNFWLTKRYKSRIQEELDELRRVGSQPFQAMLRDDLVAFDLSVIDEKRTYSNYGEFRLGGMQPACIPVRLPAAFVIKRYQFCDDGLLRFCCRDLQEGDDENFLSVLTWVKPDKVQWGQQICKLRYSPSSRTRGYIFTCE